MGHPGEAALARQSKASPNDGHRPHPLPAMNYPWAASSLQLALSLMGLGTPRSKRWSWVLLGAERGQPRFPSVGTPVLLSGHLCCPDGFSPEIVRGNPHEEAPKGRWLRAEARFGCRSWGSMHVPAGNSIPGGFGGKKLLFWRKKSHPYGLSKWHSAWCGGQPRVPIGHGWLRSCCRIWGARGGLEPFSPNAHSTLVPA